MSTTLVPPQSRPDVLNYAWREYADRVGIFRFLDLLPATALVNSAVYEHGSTVMDAVCARGDEVVAHGRTNAAHQADMSGLQERANRRGDGCHRRCRGPQAGRLARPVDLGNFRHARSPRRGWLHYVLDWCTDDRPVWLSTRDRGRLLSAPYPQKVNDIPAIAVCRMGAEAFADDRRHVPGDAGPVGDGGARLRRRAAPTSFGLPHLLRQLRRVLQAIVGRNGAWWTTPGEIARGVCATW